MSLDTNLQGSNWTLIMTEDIQAPTSINQNMSSEKPQLQVIDIIDQLANSSEICPYEITEINPGSPFVEENQEGTKHLAENSAHQISDATKELQGKMTLVKLFFPVALEKK